MPTLNTYSDWVMALEKFGNGDDSALYEMDAGSFVLDAGTAQRFYQRVEEAYKKRKKVYLDKFNAAFQFYTIRNADDFSIAIRNAKANLLPLSKFISANGLPEPLRKSLSKDLEAFIVEMQEALKKKVPRDSMEREKILLLLNSFSFQTTEENNTLPNHKSVTTAIPAYGRKIIF